MVDTHNKRRRSTLYGFCFVRVRAFRGKDGILLALTGVDKEVRKAKALFES
jgi:hypothetical protein